MNKYNPNIHHRRSIRLKGYDYSQAGLYFITICVQDRVCCFGEIKNGKMILNEYGEIVYNEWLKTPELRKNVELDVFVIMPNHMHGIIILNGNSPDNATIHNHITNEFHMPNDKQGECNSPQRIWQRNYYEHIIRNQQSYQTISEYIINNPEKWMEDKFYKS